MKPPIRLIWTLSTSLLAGIFAQHATAAPPGWPQSYSAEGADAGQKLARDARGNIYVGGTVWQGDPGWGVAIVKYTAGGRQLWARVFDPDSPDATRADDNFRTFAVDAGGNVYLAVAHFDPFASLVVVKLDPDGKLLWQQHSEGFAAELALDAGGNCFIAGTIEGTSPQAFLVKFNPDGQLLWERRYGSPNFPSWGSAQSLAVDPAGDIFVVGFQFTVSKFDAAGAELWRKDYFGQSADRVLTDPFGNAYVIGTGLEADTLTVKLDPAGEEIWTFVYYQADARWTNPTDFTLDDRGNVFFATFTDTGNLDLVKLNADGTFAWRNDETGIAEPLSGLSYLNSLAVDDHGRSWFLFTSNSPSGTWDALLSHYGADGRRLSRTHLKAQDDGDEFAGDIFLDPLGRPIVTFTAFPPNGVSSWITARLFQSPNRPIWRP